MSTCNWLDLETLGPRLIMHKNRPGYLYQTQLSQGMECSQILQHGLQHIEVCPWWRALAAPLFLSTMSFMLCDIWEPWRHVLWLCVFWYCELYSTPFVYISTDTGGVSVNQCNLNMEVNFYMDIQCASSDITLLRPIAVSCGTDSILRNISHNIVYFEEENWVPIWANSIGLYCLPIWSNHPYRGSPPTNAHLFVWCTMNNPFGSYGNPYW